MKAIFYSKDPAFEPIILNIRYLCAPYNEYVEISIPEKLRSNWSEDTIISSKDHSHIGIRYEYVDGGVYYICVDKYSEHLKDTLKLLPLSHH